MSSKGYPDLVREGRALRAAQKLPKGARVVEQSGTPADDLVDDVPHPTWVQRIMGDERSRPVR